MALPPAPRGVGVQHRAFPVMAVPAIILVFVAILVAGPVMSASAPRPTAPSAVEQRTNPGTNEGAGAATPTQGEQNVSPTVAVPTATIQSLQSPPTPSPATSTTSAALTLEATRTAVAQAGERGEVAREPVRLEFGGASFAVKAGGAVLPDWKPSPDGGTATWLEGTVANHIIYLQYSEKIQALFKAAKPGDVVKLTMNTGQVFSFAVTRSERAANGPATKEGQFTVSTAMAQDHAGLTLFLIGDPAADRAVVQADFTGNIQ